MENFQQFENPIKPEQIIEIVIRQRWLIIIPLCITLTIGLFVTLTANKTYEAATAILVQPQRVPTNYVRSVVTTTISQRISTISQQILSRSNLEKIIDQFGLYENAHGMYLEDKIMSMRKRVRVKIDRARHGTESFSISFTGSNPERVMRVANTLATYFMDENLKVREAQALGTSEFLDSELEKSRKRLEEHERKLSEYRGKHLGGLPDELESNLRTLDRLQEQLSSKQNDLREARNSLNMISNQMNQAQKMGSTDFDDQFGLSDFEEDEGFAVSEDEAKLQELEKELGQLLLKYTQNHPDVKKIINAIDKLKAKIEKDNLEQAQKEPEPQINESEEIEENLEPDVNFAALQFEIQLKQANNEIIKLENDIQQINKKMVIYQQRVEDTPKREQDLQNLQRDYANIRDVFNSLLSRKLEAELSLNMERKQKGEQFRILDHARLPEKPISPNVKLFFLFSIASGLGIGAGIIFLLEFFNNSIRWDDQIEKDLGLPILASIPPLVVEKKKGAKKIEIIFFILVTLYAGMIFSFFAVLNSKGLDRTINFIKMVINF